jgi:peptidoglycan/LPS O-acetylase OafA/YrhL
MMKTSGQRTTLASRESILRKALHEHAIPGLDAMRAVAICLVVLFHQGLPVSGPLGVVVFFVLSGFLITSLLLKEIRNTGTISLRNFYRRRAFRIFPAFYLCWIVTAVLMLATHRKIIWKEALASFFYLANYARAVLPVSRQANFFMGISWSLAIEEQFYLLWPLSLLWIWRKPRRAAHAVVGIILAIWLWRAVLMVSFGVPWSYIYNAFDTRADALMVGSLLAILLYGERIPAFLFPLISTRWLVLVPIAALALVSRLDLYPPRSLMLQLISFSLAPVLAAVILLQWVFWGAAGWRFLEHWSIKLIARLSYAIYLYHPMALGLQRYIPVPHGQRLLVIPIMLAIAAASYYLVERPFMRIRDRGRRASILMDDGLKH